MRCTYQEALDRLRLLEFLAPFDPHVAGTPPLGIDVPNSDIDILVCVEDASLFTEVMWSRFASLQGFSIRQWISNERAVITRFETLCWEFEIFASATPVEAQPGWRHFKVEERLLDLGGNAFRNRIMALRHAGMKTEPAFARALHLTGNPYQALLELEAVSDERLTALIGAATL